MKHLRQPSLSPKKSTSIFSFLLLASIIASFCFSGGCATTQDSTSQFTPITFDSSKAVIYVYRESRFVEAINKAEIFITNQYAGQLVNGSYCTHVTDPGLVEIKAIEKIPPILVLPYIISTLSGEQPLIEFTAEPGQEHFIEFNVAGYKVKQVSKGEALGLMNGLKPAEYTAEQTD